jgi:ribosome biogenesis GTPase A
MLDMPGILWPKFDDHSVGLNLAFTGAIKDDVIDIVDVASKLMEKLSKTYPNLIKSRYKLDLTDEETGYMLLEAAGRKRGCLVSGGNVDLNRIAVIVLDEFEEGKLEILPWKCRPNNQNNNTL